MDLVVGVEELSDGSVDVGRRLEGRTSLGPSKREVESEVSTSRRTVAVHRVAARGVVLRDDVVAASVEVDGVLTALEVGGNGVPSGGGGELVQLDRLALEELTLADVGGVAGGKNEVSKG